MLHQDWTKLNAPAPYEPGEPAFWNDPHIARQMLRAHLDQSTEAASYRAGRIDSICAFLPEAMGIPPGGDVVDLGCGPGLYCARLATAGYRMTGLDFSPVAIEHGRATVPDAQFRVENYLDWHEENRYDGALLIYEDYGVLPPADRRRLLANVRRALRPGGAFALDVASNVAFAEVSKRPEKTWTLEEAGFWRPHRHMVLQQLFLYPDIPSTCQQYAVYDGTLTVYRVHLTYYTPSRIGAELEEAGFTMESVYATLTGEPWREDAPQIAVVCRKTA